MSERTATYVFLPNAKEIIPQQELQEQMVKRVIDKLYDRNINASNSMFINRFVILYDNKKVNFYAVGMEEKGIDKITFLTMKDAEKLPTFVKMLAEFDKNNPGMSDVIDEFMGKM